MQKISCKMTVLFNGQFWIGVYERVYGTKLEVSKIIFGSEPKDIEIYDYILKNWSNLKFSPSVETDVISDTRINPKRMQRKIKKQINDLTIGTKAQQAIKLQQSNSKNLRKKNASLKREQEKEAQFLLKQQKRKYKHRGH